ncbi:MAG: ROK family protein, partial [Phocaeicola sp.]
MKLTIDLGGTNIRIAQIENDHCLQTKSIPCLSNESALIVINQLIELIQSMMDKDVESIGIGVPSILNPETGVVYNVANIPSWDIIPLKEIIEQRFGIPTAINNDSNCFTLGEKYFGKGKPFCNMVGVTIGTGIGTGIIINEQLYSGQYAGAGEMGSLPYLDSDFEQYCSSQFFKKCYNTTGEVLAERAAQNDETALKIWEEFGNHLGNFIKAILYAYSP